MLKIIGIILVCGASSLLGTYFGSLPQHRVDELNLWKKALLMLRAEIAFASSPLPEAMRNISMRAGKPVGPVFLDIAQALEAREKTDMSLIWARSFAKGQKESHLSDEDRGWINNFGQTLGYLDKQMQIGAIDLACGYMDSQAKALGPSCVSAKKMCQSLGVLGGILIAVVLI
ncbi:MAG: stage III sporulation protein AB [Clostridiales bacterium]|jgi:stage III sporulation protein AB|nr:stage III sporulation protein AB [Clostridiales bacterium]